MNHQANFDVCPLTNKKRNDKYRISWTRSDRLGSYNACPECCDDLPRSLQELNASRKAEQEKGSKVYS